MSEFSETIGQRALALDRAGRLMRALALIGLALMLLSVSGCIAGGKTFRARATVDFGSVASVNDGIQPMATPTDTQGVEGHEVLIVYAPDGTALAALQIGTRIVVLGTVEDLMSGEAAKPAAGGGHSWSAEHTP